MGKGTIGDVLVALTDQAIATKAADTAKDQQIATLTAQVQAGGGGTPERFYTDLDGQTQGILTSSELGPGMSPDADNSTVAFALGQFVAYSIYVKNAIDNGFQANLEDFRSWFLSNQG